MEEPGPPWPALEGAAEGRPCQVPGHWGCCRGKKGRTPALALHHTLEEGLSHRPFFVPVLPASPA